jgi:predicted acetyltransferase
MPLPTATWLADVATVPAFRRRGIARALLAHILAEDARLGARHSVLLATQSGALLYPHLGYERRGLLQIYAPPRGA